MANTEVADPFSNEGIPSTQAIQTAHPDRTPPPDYVPSSNNRPVAPSNKDSLKWFPDTLDSQHLTSILAFFGSIFFCMAMFIAFVISVSGVVAGVLYDDAVEDFCVYNNITTYSFCEYDTCSSGGDDCVSRTCSGSEATYFYNTLNGTCDNSNLYEIALFSACYCEDIDNEWTPQWMVNANGTPPAQPADDDMAFTCYINSCGTTWMGPGGDYTRTHPDSYTKSGLKAFMWCLAFMTVMCGLCCVGCRNHPKCFLHDHLQRCCASKKE